MRTHQCNQKASPTFFLSTWAARGPRALKIDMVLRGLHATDRRAIVEEVLRRTKDSRPERLGGRRYLQGTGDADGAQYIGVNFAPNSAPYVNCYFSGARPAARGADAHWEDAALAAVAAAQTARGAYGHEGFRLRPAGTPDTAGRRRRLYDGVCPAVSGRVLAQQTSRN